MTQFKPITIGPFTLASKGRLLVEGDPSVDEWEAVGPVIAHFDRNAKWWLGAWLNYGETTYGEMYSQAASLVGYAPHSLENIAYVERNVPISRRREELSSWGHWEEIARVDPKRQSRWVTKCISRNLTLAELRLELRNAKREPVVENLAEMQGKFRVVYADPPWRYADSGASSASTSFGKAEDHYPTLSIEEIAAIPVKDHVLRNAVLALWVTEPLRFEAKPIIDSWGFTHKTAIVWDKADHGLGHYVSVRHEHLLICTRGSCTPAPQDLTPMIDSVQTIRRGRRRHSEKPEEFRRIIDRLYPTGPKLEMFGRRQVENWTVWGNQIGESVENGSGRQRSGRRGGPMAPSPLRSQDLLQNDGRTTEAP